MIKCVHPLFHKYIIYHTYRNISSREYDTFNKLFQVSIDTVTALYGKTSVGNVGNNIVFASDMSVVICSDNLREMLQCYICM